MLAPTPFGYPQRLVVNRVLGSVEFNFLSP